jgi:hypothetical protein
LASNANAEIVSPLKFGVGAIATPIVEIITDCTPPIPLKK